MNTREPSVLGRGVYTPAEASRLTGVNQSSFRRWFLGYHYENWDGSGSPPAVLTGEYGRAHGRFLLSFLDLQQARVVHRLTRKLAHGRHLSLQTIRRFVERASELWGTRYPLAHERLQHDGHTIWERVGEGETQYLLDIVRNQTAMVTILDPFLHDVVWQDGLASAWYPGQHIGAIGTRVVVNPLLRFGRPVASTSHVETRILAAVAAANGSAEVAAAWYGVPIQDVTASVAYEESLVTRRRAA